MQRAFDGDAVQREVQERFRMLPVGQPRGHVGQPSGVAVQIEGILTDVVPELFGGKRPVGQLPHERVSENLPVDREGRLPGLVAPSFHGFQRL